MTPQQNRLRDDQLANNINKLQINHTFKDLAKALGNPLQAENILLSIKIGFASQIRDPNVRQNFLIHLNKQKMILEQQYR